MSPDRPYGPGSDIPEDAADGDDDTLDLTEAMAVVPPSGDKDPGAVPGAGRDASGQTAPDEMPDDTPDDTINLADVTTVVGGLSGEDAAEPRNSGEMKPGEDGESEMPVDLAAAAEAVAPDTDVEEDEEDEFGSPARTVAISPGDLASMGLSRGGGSAGPQIAEEEDPDASPVEDAIREQPADGSSAFHRDEDDRFLDIDTGTLIAMGREFEKNGESEDAEEGVLDLDAVAARPEDSEYPDADDPADPAASTVLMAPDDESPDDESDDEESDDDDVLDLGTIASAPGDSEEPDDADPADPDASTVLMALDDESPDEESDDDALDLGTIASAPEDSEEPDADDPADPAASTVLMAPDDESPDDESDDDDALDLGTIASAPEDSEEPDADDPADPDASTVLMALDDESPDDDDVLDLGTIGTPSEEPSPIAGEIPPSSSGTPADGDPDAEFLVDSLTVFGPRSGDAAEADRSDFPEEGESDRDAETMVVPPGGWDGMDAARSGSEEDEAEDAARNAETMFASMADWEYGSGDDSGLSALELLDSISALPSGEEIPPPSFRDETDEADDLLPLPPEPDGEDAIPDDMEALYDLLDAGGAATPPYRETVTQSPGTPSPGPPPGTPSPSSARDDGTGAATPPYRTAAPDFGRNDADGAEERKAEAPDTPEKRPVSANSVAIPGARRSGETGGERCFSITPDQMQTILERVVDKIFSEKIEKILTDVIERAVAAEMRKLESYFMDELDDRPER